MGREFGGEILASRDTERRLGERLSRALGPAGQYRPLPNRQVSRPYMYARSCWAWTSGHAALRAHPGGPARPCQCNDGYAVRAHAHVVVGMIIRLRFLADHDPARLPGALNADYECDRSAGMHWSHPTQKIQICGVRRCRLRRQRLPQSPMSWLTNAAPALLRALRGRVTTDLPEPEVDQAAR